MAKDDGPKAEWNGTVVINSNTPDPEVRAIEKRLREQFPKRDINVVRKASRW